MANKPEDAQLSRYILDLLGPEPYAGLYDASNQHREAHGQQCGVFPSSPLSMTLVSFLVEATGARRILEIGCGLGYSALWLGEACGKGGTVDTIERDATHAG